MTKGGEKTKANKSGARPPGWALDIKAPASLYLEIAPFAHSVACFEIETVIRKNQVLPREERCLLIYAIGAIQVALAALAQYEYLKSVATTERAPRIVDVIHDMERLARITHDGRIIHDGPVGPL